MFIDLRADLNSENRPLHHPWRTCVGSGHATLALRADWQTQLRQAKHELGFDYVRFHGLLDDDMGTLTCQNNELLYSFFNADQIVDFLMSIGMRPIIELSFMPLALSSGGDIVFHYKGNITPPRDFVQWGELMRRLAQHWVERYGLAEVTQWYFEVWNEPNLPAFWTGDQDGYFELYATTVNAIKGVNPGLQVGGPATANNEWIPAFLEYCRTHGVAVDFVSTHYYPTDAFGTIGADTITQLAHAAPDVMRKGALTVQQQAQGKPILYTEWNITSNPRDPMHDSAIAAALATRIIMSIDDVVQAYSYWTFSDIFEENYFPSVPFHGGFGLMNLHGIKKPIYAAFELINMLGERHFPVEQTHPTVMLWIGERTIDAVTPLTTQILCINQAMPLHPIVQEDVVLTLTGRPGHYPTRVSIRRIDEHNANPAGLWRQWGQPDSLSPAQVRTLKEAARPPVVELPFERRNDSIVLHCVVAPQSVNLVQIEWQRSDHAIHN